MRFSKVLNLTSVDDAEVFKQRFIQPSLAMCSMLPDTGRLLDVGSGMGVPGVPVLLAKPGLYGLLVERRKKRAEFLRHIKRALNLRVDIYDKDIQNLPKLRVNAIVARAVAAPGRLLSMCSRHCEGGAVAVLTVARKAEPAPVQGWQLLGIDNVQAEGEGVIVHRYVYEDVSRET